MNDAEKTLQREPDDALDLVLRSELRWEAPPELTQCLLALVPAAPVLGYVADAKAPLLPRAQPKRWYTWLVMILTVAAVGLSCAVAWEFYGALGTELGLVTFWTAIQTAMANGLQQVYEAAPVTRQIVALLSGISEQLYWLLLAAVLWLALDGWTPRLRRQQQTS